MSAESFLINVQDPRFPKLGDNFHSYEEWLELSEFYTGPDRSMAAWEKAKKASSIKLEKEENHAYEYIEIFNETKERDASGESAEYLKTHLAAPMKALRDKGLTDYAIIRVLQNELDNELARNYLRGNRPQNKYHKTCLYPQPYIQDEDHYHISEVLDFYKLWATKVPARDLDVELAATKNG
jgi:hypothetical protein